MSKFKIIILIASVYSTSSIANCSWKKVTSILGCDKANKCLVSLDNTYEVYRFKPIIGALFEYCEKKKEVTEPVAIVPIIEPIQIVPEVTSVEEVVTLTETVAPEEIKPEVVEVRKEIKYTCKKQRITGFENCVNRTTCDAILEDGNYIQVPYPVYIGELTESCEVVE